MQPKINLSTTYSSIKTDLRVEQKFHRSTFADFVVCPKRDKHLFLSS